MRETGTKSQVEAIDAVMDKRHSRMMAAGLSESEAAAAIVRILESMSVTWKDRPEVLACCKNLIIAYSVPI